MRTISCLTNGSLQYFLGVKASRREASRTKRAVLLQGSQSAKEVSKRKLFAAECHSLYHLYLWIVWKRHGKSLATCILYVLVSNHQSTTKNGQSTDYPFAFESGLNDSKY